MWAELDELWAKVGGWINAEQKAAEHRAQGRYFFSILDADKDSKVSNFQRLLNEVAGSRPKFQKVFPDAWQFEVLTALAVVGPEELWEEAAWAHLIELSKELTGELARYFQPGHQLGSRGSPALDFTAAWLLRDGSVVPQRVSQVVQRYVLDTVESVLTWLNHNVPGFCYSPGDAGTLAGAVFDLLFGWPNAPCPCCGIAFEHLKKRAADRGQSFDFDFAEGLMPQALFYKRHVQRSNEEKHIINCFCFHRFRAYLKFRLVSSLALAQFLRQAVRGSYSDINSAFLTGGMIYPLLTQRYNVDEVNVASVLCQKCTNSKKEFVRNWHENDCSHRQSVDVTTCSNCKAKYNVAKVYSWNLKQCASCEAGVGPNQRIDAVKMHIITSEGSGFSFSETHTCQNKNCGTIFKAELCRMSSGDHKQKESGARHDKCPQCGTPHRGAPVPDDPEPDQRSFRTSEVYWFEESGKSPDQLSGELWESELIIFMAEHAKEDLPLGRLPSEPELKAFLAKWKGIDGAPQSSAELRPKWAATAKKVVAKWATESGWEAWAIEVIKRIPAPQDGSFRLDRLPLETELGPLLAEWKEFSGAPKTYAELCEKWHDLLAGQNTSDAQSEY